MIPLLLATAWAGVTAFVGATVHPVSGPPVADAVLVVADGVVVALGTADEVAVPAGAEVIDVTGKVIVPGLVDTHSHIGGARLNDHLGPVQAGLHAVDAIDPTHDSVARARAGGLTTVNVMPGSGSLLGGATAYLKLRRGAVVDDLLLCEEPADPQTEGAGPLRRSAICGGVKMANGTNPQGSGAEPASRMGAAYLQRKALLRGQKRAAAEAAALEAPRRRGLFRRKGEAVEPLEPDPEAELLAQIVRGERTVHFHTHRADDIVTILRLREEFGFDLVLQHVSEAWKVVEPIAAAGVPVSLIVIDSPGGKEEALEIRAENAALLEAAGVSVALHTDDPITDSRLFLRSAGLAVRAGMTPAGALAALTLEPARMMGLDHRVGSLEPGKDADLVVLSGSPWSVWTLVEQTWVEGQCVFDRSRPRDRALAVGGERAPEVR